jgi:hypothetical protein
MSFANLVRLVRARCPHGLQAAGPHAALVVRSPGQDIKREAQSAALNQTPGFEMVHEYDRASQLHPRQPRLLASQELTSLS